MPSHLGRSVGSITLLCGGESSNSAVWLLGRHKHASAVTWVQIVLNYVVSSGDDGTVKLWDLETGDFIRNLVKLESAGNGGRMNSASYSVVRVSEC